MQAFLYLNLTQSTAFHQPVAEQVRRDFPQVSVLDLDARSDELLQHYALRLLRESHRAAVCIKADEEATELASIMPLLEELFEEGRQRLVILIGLHPRLQRIFAARPHVAFKAVVEEEVVGEVRSFLEV